MAWTYSNEDFDQIQGVANALTQADRDAGLPTAPRYGYSAKRFTDAHGAVNALHARYGWTRFHTPEAWAAILREVGG